MTKLCVVDGDGWVHKIVEVDKPGVFKCPECGQQKEVAGKVVLRDGRSTFLCRNCLGLFFALNWPVCDDDGNIGTTGWSIHELNRISRTNDRRTDR